MSSSVKGPRAANSDDEPPISSVRAQTAIVRTLADALKHHTASGEAGDSLRKQLMEELSRLGLTLSAAGAKRR
jgi:hypothetical protein